MLDITKERLEAIAGQFRYEGKVTQIRPYGNGHINNTFLLELETEGGPKLEILQQINRHVFQRPEEVMENIVNVTRYLKQKILENGGDPLRETLNLVPALDGKAYYQDEQGEFWRSYHFITDAACYDRVEAPRDFYESARSFGRFQYLLADYPAETLHETIPGFHDTAARLAVFRKTVEEDAAGRAGRVQDEIRFVLEREETAHCFGTLLEQKQIPLRVTHNDTKLNNIMIDKRTGKGICVIDLDTVMPGLAMNDFGDSIRFGASTAAEDEPDLSRVSCDLSLFETYTKGFLEGCGKTLTRKETELLPMGARVMTYECGMRFLTDYLQGDVYFKTHRPDHNLDRCRTQFKLVADMEEKQERMQEIVEKFL